MKKIYILSSALVSVPFIAFAEKNTLATLIGQIIGYANQILVLLMGVAVVMFVFYIIKYYIKADADRKAGGLYVMYSLIGFFVILSFWGLVNILQNTFDLKNEDNRPAGWASFSNIFPGGGSTRTPTPTNIGTGGVSNPTPTNIGTGGTSSGIPAPIMMAPYMKDPTTNKPPLQ